MINISHHVIAHYIYIPSDAYLQDCRQETETANIQRYFEFLYNPFHYFYKVRWT